MMIGRKVLVLSGIISIIIGFLFILNSFSGITGFAVFDDLGRGKSSIIGVVLIIAGIVLLSARRDYEWGEKGLRSRESLRKHNEEARYYSYRAFRQQYHRKPNKEELREFVRVHHERGWLHDLVGAFK